jgi:hypothetical protein
MTFRLACALALCSFVVGGAAAASCSASLAPPSAHFRPAAGWNVAKPTRSEQPNTFASMVIAVTADDTLSFTRSLPSSVSSGCGREESSSGPPRSDESRPRRFLRSRARAGRSVFPPSASIAAGRDSPPRTSSNDYERSPSAVGTSRCASTLRPSTPTKSCSQRHKLNSIGYSPLHASARAARVLRCRRPDRTQDRPPVHANRRRLDTFEMMTTGTRRAVACV